MYAVKAIPMNHEENAERQEREVRYRDSQDDVSSIRRELNKLTGAVGEMLDCLKGNDLGSDGLVKQVRGIKDWAETISARVSKLENSEKFREKAWRIVFALLGVVAGSFLKTFIDHLFAQKK